MYNRLAILILGLTLMAPTATFAQTLDVGGRIVRVDPGAQIIVLDNHQAYRVTPSTTLFVNNQPVSLSALQPGEAVVIRSGESVTVTPSAPTAAQSPVTVPGSTVVVAPQAPVPALGQQTLFGRVTDVDRGEIKIKTENDHFEVKVPREMAAQVRKGDTVRLDLTFQR